MAVAFQAHPSSHITDKPKNTKIVFDVADTNVGNAYNAKDGVFTAPVDAVYAFHWTTMVHPGKSFPTNLIVNGNIKAKNHGYANYGLKDWYSPSQMFVGPLKHGDKVWLATGSGLGQYLHRDSFSTFSGYKL